MTTLTTASTNSEMSAELRQSILEKASPSLGSAPFSQFPFDLFVEVTSYLSCIDLASLAQTNCRDYHYVAIAISGIKHLDVLPTQDTDWAGFYHVTPLYRQNGERLLRTIQIYTELDSITFSGGAIPEEAHRQFGQFLESRSLRSLIFRCSLVDQEGKQLSRDRVNSLWNEFISHLNLKETEHLDIGDLGGRTADPDERLRSFDIFGSGTSTTMMIEKLAQCQQLKTINVFTHARSKPHYNSLARFLSALPASLECIGAQVTREKKSSFGYFDFPVDDAVADVIINRPNLQHIRRCFLEFSSNAIPPAKIRELLRALPLSQMTHLAFHGALPSEALTYLESQLSVNTNLAEFALRDRTTVLNSHTTQHLIESLNSPLLSRVEIIYSVAMPDLQILKRKLELLKNINTFTVNKWKLGQLRTAIAQPPEQEASSEISLLSVSSISQEEIVDRSSPIAEQDHEYAALSLDPDDHQTSSSSGSSLQAVSTDSQRELRYQAYLNRANS